MKLFIYLLTFVILCSGVVAEPINESAKPIRQPIEITIKYKDKVYNNFLCNVISIDGNKAMAINTNDEKSIIQVLVHKKHIKRVKKSISDYDLLIQRWKESNQENALKEELKEWEVVQIKRVEIDKMDYFYKKFSIKGTVSLSTYFNYEYSDCKNTHYAFDIHEADSMFAKTTVYIDKTDPKAKELVELLLKTPRLFGTFKIQMTRYDKNNSSIMADLIDYK